MAKLKNFGFKRGSGILLGISSLPSKYGIGGFGKEAYKFVDFLAECKVKCWQVLPLNPTSYGDSPYQSPAASFGNPYFIDPEVLFEKGLLTRAQLRAAEHNTHRVDYGFLFFERYPLLRIAYEKFLSRGGNDCPDYLTFVKKGEKRLSDYALFMALKVHYGFRPWTEWDDVHKSVASARRRKGDFAAECGFWTWIQYEFCTEWRALVDYAHERGISVEAEVGHIGGQEDNISAESLNATLEDCRVLYDNTHIDSLAPALGSVHGFYKGEPNLDFETMDLINKNLPIPLVLHGGTGIPNDKIEQAIKCGISKININTDLQVVWTKAVREFLATDEKAYDPGKVIGSGELAIKQRIEEIVTLFKTKM